MRVKLKRYIFKVTLQFMARFWVYLLFSEINKQSEKNITYIAYTISMTDSSGIHSNIEIKVTHLDRKEYFDEVSFLVPPSGTDKII